jgi:hypothetical protein
VLLHCELGLLNQGERRPCITWKFADGAQITLARQHYATVSLMQDRDHLLDFGVEFRGRNDP